MDEGWTKHEPQVRREDTSDSVRVVGIRLLAPEDVIAANIDVPGLAAVVRDIEDRTIPSLVIGPDAYEILVRCILSPTARPVVQIASQGKAPEAVLERLSGELEALSDVRARVESIGFDVQFAVSAESMGPDQET